MLAPLATVAAPAAQPAPATALTVQALAYRRVAPSRDGAAVPLDDAARAIGTLACAERERLCGAVGADDYVVSSTILSMLLMNDSPQHRVFAQALAGANDYTPDWMTCSYECAGWGYVLRRSLATAAETGPRTLLLQIVDIDVHGYTYWHGNPAWGRSGFGVCTLLVDVGREASSSAPSVLAEAAPPASAVVRLGRDIRTFCAARPGLHAALPFFPATSRRALLASVGKTPLLPDGHGVFGHAFGSDPWLSVLLAHRDGDTPRRAAVCSLALNGYYSVADVAFAPDATFSLDDEA
ncbi:hypothetical protein [Burkholderia contaminans]|uniref:hypothetical protein n=1 Tax=Burkholderia contaminans TaxID=488447 RepID=UPI000863A121|nr:hypothetical protein [Burkholderia contaminans]AOL08736.1 hypothetical protein WI95_32375 [Burkholderia contaminans]MCA8157386.1 hypothetical protein [Burkholderia contaminans]VWC72868.1 hypothetical protein BCO19218_00680 [Burkholderia contaminans]